MKYLILVIFLLMPLNLHAETIVPSPEWEAEIFTQSFYDWYLQKGKDRNMDDVLKYKKNVLSPILYQLLKADRDAQAKSPGEIVGLDFDPFLNAQDVAQKYEVGKAVLKDKNYWVDLRGFWNGKKGREPDLQAEIACSASCVFVNFHYGRDRNLISVLKALKKDR